MLIYLLIVAELLILGIATWYFYLRQTKVSQKNKNAVWGRYPDLKPVKGDTPPYIHFENDP